MIETNEKANLPYYASLLYSCFCLVMQAPPQQVAALIQITFLSNCFITELTNHLSGG